MQAYVRQLYNESILPWLLRSTRHNVIVHIHNTQIHAVHYQYNRQQKDPACHKWTKQDLTSPYTRRSRIER